MHCNRSEMILSWPKMRSYVDWNRCERMLSWPNLKCYVDWKGCDRKLSRKVLGTMWIRIDVKICCLDLIRGALLIGKDVSGSFHEQFQVLCWLYQIWNDVVIPSLRWQVYWRRYEWKISRTIWGNMWKVTDEKGWCPDLNWGDMLIGTDDKDCCYDLIWSAALIPKDLTERFDDQLEW
jgi:hypothetical protein